MEIKFQKTYLEDIYQGNTKSYKEYKSNKQLVFQYVKTINKLKSITHINQLFQLKALRYEIATTNSLRKQTPLITNAIPYVTAK